MAGRDGLNHRKVICQVASPAGVTVHRGLVERRNIHIRLDILGQDTTGSVGKTHTFGSKGTGRVQNNLKSFFKP
jgi:hypothetical protein